MHMTSWDAFAQGTSGWWLQVMLCGVTVAADDPVSSLHWHATYPMFQLV